MISTKAFSLSAAFSIRDDFGTPAYEAAAGLLARGPWKLTRADGAQGIVGVERGGAAWEVTGPCGAWRVLRKFRWFTSEWHIEGGPFDGAIFVGKPFTSKYTITHGGRMLARVEGGVSYSVEAHRLSMLVPGEHAEWLAVTTVMIQVRFKADASSG